MALAAKMFFDALGITQDEVKQYIEEAREFVAVQREVVERIRHMHILAMQGNLAQVLPDVYAQNTEYFKMINQEFLGEEGLEILPTDT